MRRLTRSYVDESRPADDPNGLHSDLARHLNTWLRVPEGSGPFPLIVFAHGDSGHPRKVTRLLDAWAGAGYVVAAPAFPLTNDDVEPTVIGDYVNQPADVSRVIDCVLADSGRGRALVGLVDASRIGVAGHSLGGATVFGLVSNSATLDARVGCAVVLNGFRPGSYDGARMRSGVALLVVHGTADTRVPFEMGLHAFDEWRGPKWLLTLAGALHSDHVEDLTSVHDDVVIECTTLFFDAQLRGDVDATRRFERWTPPSDLAELRR